MAICESLSPIDIIVNSEVNECTNKCDLTYKYAITEPILSMTNKGTYLSYVFTQTDENFAELDNEVFKLVELQIYSPSVHRYNSINQIAELLLIHNNASNSSYQLIISIPITQSGATIVDQGFTNLLSLSKTHIPSASSGTQNFLVPSLNLNNFIGKTGFYTYDGNHIGECLQKASYVVFYPSNFALFISNEYLSNNKITILENSNISPQVNNNYFYNKNEAKYFLGNGVYMDCIAVNTSEETIDSPVYSSTLSTSFMNSPTVKMIFSVCIITCFMAAVIFIIYIIFIQTRAYFITETGTDKMSK